ncbi:hypothetical protein V1286_003404 [Bradyrhizobium algeriense]|uniref:Uncharacterized protein n=1 Tax=Bradyrhizobium algeriense TaxID=634784 RepID=A0ABU8BBN6_9BRAD
MAIVYKTGQPWATGWTEFGPIRRLSRCRSCAKPWREKGSAGGMKILGRILGATCVIAALTGPVWAQNPIPRYGETDKEKSATEKAAERDAERAYKRSLGNIPEQKSTDPWGTMRSDSAPPKAAAKDTAKASPAKPKAKSADGAAK